jgi:hypothetical protein
MANLLPTNTNAIAPSTLTDAYSNVYQLKGCFIDKGDRAIRHYLGNKSGGINENKNAIPNAQECIKRATEFGYDTVGLQYTGECWADNQVNIKTTNGVINNNYGRYAIHGHQSRSKDTSCDINNPQIGGWTNVVYQRTAGQIAPPAPALFKQYRFDSDTIRGLQLANSANASLVYDATSSEPDVISYTDYKVGNGSLSLYGGANVKIDPFTIPNTNGMTISCWFKSNKTQDRGSICDFGNGEGVDNISMSIINGCLTFTMYATDIKTKSAKNYVWNSGINANDNIWRHAAWTINIDGTWKMYINGKLVGSTNVGFYPISRQLNLNYLGKSNWKSGHIFNGSIDEFRIYSGVVADNDILNLSNPQYQAINGLPMPPPIGVLMHYSFANRYVSDVTITDVKLGTKATVMNDTPDEITSLNYETYNDACYIANGTYVSIPALITGSIGITFACWFKTSGAITGTAGQWSRIFDFGNGVANSNIVMAYPNNMLTLWAVDIDGTVSTTQTNINIGDNKWRHIVWTIDVDGTWTIYINNVKTTTFSGIYPASIQRSSNFLCKSNWTNDGITNGAIADFIVYDGIASKSDIATLYSSTSYITDHRITKAEAIAMIEILKKNYKSYANNVKSISTIKLQENEFAITPLPMTVTAPQFTYSGDKNPIKNGDYTITASSTEYSLSDLTFSPQQSFNIIANANQGWASSGAGLSLFGQLYQDVLDVLEIKRDSSAYATFPYANKGNYIGNKKTLLIDETTLNGEWIQIKLPYQVQLTQIGVLSNFKNFSICGSTDGKVWTKLRDITNDSGATFDSNKCFPVTAISTYSYFRIVVTNIFSNISEYIGQTNIKNYIDGTWKTNLPTHINWAHMFQCKLYGINQQIAHPEDVLGNPQKQGFQNIYETNNSTYRRGTSMPTFAGLNVERGLMHVNPNMARNNEVTGSQLYKKNMNVQPISIESTIIEESVENTYLISDNSNYNEFEIYTTVLLTVLASTIIYFAVSKL